MNSRHTEYSTYREKLIEHLFVAELLKSAWTDGSCHIEVAKPEVDNSGYDLIVEANQIIRHVQLKASYIGSKTSRQKVHVKLGEKPSGCVVWIYFDEGTLDLGPFLFFGGPPGLPLPSLADAKVAKHSKGNSYGAKTERPNIRELNKGSFTSYDSIFSLYQALFGENS